MDKNRLRHLAGLTPVPETIKRLLENEGMDSLSEVQQIADQIFALAEGRAADSAADAGGRALEGDAIWEQYEAIKTEIEDILDSKIAGDMSGDDMSDMQGGEDRAAMMDRGVGMRDEPDDFDDYEDKYGAE